jgi:hypothetical protein
MVLFMKPYRPVALGTQKCYGMKEYTWKCEGIKGLVRFVEVK